MKKFLITFLAVLACMLTVVAFGCKNDGKKSGNKEYTVEFVPTENLEYVCDELADGETTIKVKSGKVVNFSVTVPTLYEVPTVYANGNSVKAEDGVYSVKVTGNVTITTSEVSMPSPVITGDGTAESPALISSPADYLYIAERINSGDYSFAGLYYALENDIDFGGTEIPVIGDGSTASSYFVGNFNGKGYTISNFKINTYGISYVGLFGYVVSSGSGDDGTGMIVNLNIDNFEITAQATQLSSMFVGSFVGYGIASSVIACKATNGYIEVKADSAAFSYVGGAIGVQNSATLANGNSINYYPASVSYVYTDVYVNGAVGGILAAGGVVGYAVSENERAISSVINCYAVGDVNGGIYSGGVVGYLGDYSSIVNSYSLSEVYAYSRYRDNETYSHAYAGGLAGYIGNNSVITDSFAKCYVGGGSDTPGAGYVHTGELIGGKAAATAVADEGILFNCKSGNDVKTTSEFFKNTLFWQDCDWVITDGSYPEINMTEAVENTFTVTFNYSGKSVDGKQSRALSKTLKNEFYQPLYYYYGEEFGDTVLADSGETSYGFFFDAELTLKVPYGFIPTRNITLYTGFIDYSEVAGTYYLVSNNPSRHITLTLYKNGTYGYNDGVIYTYYDSESGDYVTTNEFTDFYTYNGTKIIFGNALFARLSGSVTVNEDANGNSVARPDLNYNLAKFAAVKAENGLKIYDGSFFTEEEPLFANRNVLSGEWHHNGDRYVFYSNYTGKINGQSFTYTLTASGDLTVKYDETTKTGTVNGTKITLDGNVLSKYDVFKGVWEIASNVNRNYEFDGMGGWTYNVKGIVKASGSYTIGENGVATLKTGLTAEIDASGLLLIKNGDKNEYFAKAGSYSGIWVDRENNVVLYIDGFGSSLAGNALISMGGATSELTYILDGFFDGDGNVHLTLLNGYALFGYLTCNKDGSFTGTFFSASTLEYYDGYNFYLLDTFEGDWVGEGTLNGITIDSINFNGLGLYENGTVSINGGAGTGYTLDANFDGTFGDYTVSFDDEKNVITLTLGSEKVELSRKDEISAYVLISEDGTKYSFNGGGNLSKGGKLTVTDKNGKVLAELGYKNISGSIGELDLVVELYATYRVTGNSVGTISIKDYKFEFRYEGDIEELKPSDKDQEDEEKPDCLILTIDNPFTGTWRVSGWVEIIEIGTLDLSNSVTGKFLDMSGEVTYTYYPEYECLLVPYITGEMTTPSSLYLIMLSEGNMVISSYNVIMSEDNLIYCAHGDGLNSVLWKNAANSQQTLRFDGMADSLYTVGIALSESGEVYFYTRRFGTYFFWSQDGERAYIIELNGDEEKASMVYEKTRWNYIAFYDFDLSSCILKTENDGTVYEFYLTHVEVDGVRKDYTLSRVNGDITELVIYENETNTGARFKVNHAEKTIEAID